MRPVPAAVLLLLAACVEPATAPESIASDPGFDREPSLFSNDLHPVAWSFSSPAAGLTSRLDDAGLTVEDARGPVLSFRTARWGRPGHLRELGAGSASIAPCQAGLVPGKGCAHTLDRAGEGLTEWWIGLDAGVEQGWTIAAAPPGVGPLTVDVVIEGARWAGPGTMLDAGGRPWSVGGVAAWDADHRALPVELAVNDAGLQIQVDDTGARWPIVVDPIYTTAATVLVDTTSDAGFGRAVADAGDVNGDGYGDVIVGARGYPAGGNAYVYYGSSTGVGTTPSVTLTGTEVEDYFGDMVARAGDVNGDGFDDILVAATTFGDGGLGRVYLYLGGATGLDTTADATLDGVRSAGRFGAALAGLGDVNGDGYDDVFAGEQNSSGTGYVFHGSATGIDTTAATNLSAGTYSLAYDGAGDVNGDGYGDALFGNPNISSSAGQVIVYLGSAAGLDTASPTTLSGETAGDQFGYSAAGAGDVDGDGYEDIVVAAPTYGATNTGKIYVYAGSASGLLSSPASTVTGASADYYLGHEVGGGGDVDGDGFADVVVASYLYYSDRGYVSIYQGSASGLSGTVSATITGANADDWLGYDVSDAGDVNADGYADVIAGVPGYNTAYGWDYGGAMVFLGYADVDGDGIAAVDDCDDTDASAGAPETLFVDADGDGYGSATTASACPGDAGYATVDGDCDDADATVYPGATEVADDGVDQDCDGTDAAGDTGGHKGGCGCAPGPGSGASGSLLLGALALTLRRRRPMVP